MLVGAGAVGFINMEATAVAVVFVAPVASLVVVSGVAARLVARLVVAGVDSGVGRKGVVGRLHKTVAARRKNNTHELIENTKLDLNNSFFYFQNVRQYNSEHQILQIKY